MLTIQSIIKYLLFIAFMIGNFNISSLNKKGNPIVILSTSIGKIEIEIFSAKAPVTSKNFLRYVQNGKYDAASFYRSVRLNNQVRDDILIEVIQGGLALADSIETYPAIGHETTDQTGILHKDGIISMARSTPGTASSEIFICIGDQPSLDFGGKRNADGQGFAAFGRVISGMDVVKAIHARPTTRERIDEPVRILKAEVRE